MQSRKFQENSTENFSYENMSEIMDQNATTTVQPQLVATGKNEKEYS